MNLCFVHGLPLHYDYRSGFELCPECEAINEKQAAIQEADDAAEAMQRHREEQWENER